MRNLLLLILISLLLILIFCNGQKENFSTSGLAISDQDCDKLASVYYNPRISDPECRQNAHQRICGRQRRSTVDTATGNYFYDNGVLI